jgi:predicted DNA-binding transcriptional regulator AlpA
VARQRIPPLVGLAEVAEILGVRSRQHAHNLTRDPTFPKPVTRLKATPVWTKREVVAWAKRRRRVARTPRPAR